MKVSIKSKRRSKPTITVIQSTISETYLEPR